MERYIEIQRIRLSDSFTFAMSLPPELADCLVPKMILQPIVENAILHGVDGVENGAVRVDIAQAAGHLGLYNVDTILLKYYGEGFGLTLENAQEGTGAVVTATLPIRREEGAEC